MLLPSERSSAVIDCPACQLLGRMLSHFYACSPDAAPASLLQLFIRGQSPRARRRYPAFNGLLGGLKCTGSKHVRDIVIQIH